MGSEKQVTIRARGQVTLPAPLRRTLGLNAGDRMVASGEDGRIVLDPVRNEPPAERRRLTPAQRAARAEVRKRTRPLSAAEVDAIRPVRLRGRPPTPEELRAAVVDGRE